MGFEMDAVWEARANNPHYRIRELTLPALASTGLQRFEFKTTFLPHKAGKVMMKRQGQVTDLEVIPSRLIEFESGTEGELVNRSGEEIGFTVMEFK